MKRPMSLLLVTASLTCGLLTGASGLAHATPRAVPDDVTVPMCYAGGGIPVIDPSQSRLVCLGGEWNGQPIILF